MDHFEKFEKQLLSSYESTLAVEGREISKEVDSVLEDQNFYINKAELYCSYCLSLGIRDSLDKELIKKLKKLKYELSNFRSIKNNIKGISEARKNQIKNI